MTTAANRVRREAARASQNNELLERRLLEQANAIELASEFKRKATSILASIAGDDLRALADAQLEQRQRQERGQL